MGTESELADPASLARRRVLTGVASLALAAAMVMVLASCGGDQRTGSAKARSVSPIPAYAKPRVYTVGGPHRSHAAHRRQAKRRLHRHRNAATHRRQAKRRLHRHRNAATHASDTPLTRTFSLGTQTICCATHPKTRRH